MRSQLRARRVSACIRERLSAFHVPVCVPRIKDGEKVHEAVLSPDIRGKMTAYKYVLSESLGRAAERSSFGNSLRSFATVVMLRVHCAQSFRPTCPVVHVYTCSFIARKRRTDWRTEKTEGEKEGKKEDAKGDDRVFSDRLGSERVSAVELCTWCCGRGKRCWNDCSLNERVGVIIERPRLDLIFDVPVITC